MGQMDRFNSILAEQGYVILDGGLATEMERRGADLDHHLWSARMLIESPALVAEVHRAYFAAGADVAATATYQASFEGLRQVGLNRSEAAALMRKAVDLAVSAREDWWRAEGRASGRPKPLVAASIGPFGACLHDGSEYHGNYAASWDEVRDFHRERLDVLANAGVDLLAFETIPSLGEAEILLDLLACYPGQAAWLSFSCADGAHVCHGERFEACVALAGASDALLAVGLNCTAPQHVNDLLEAAAGCRKPLLVYPNSGEYWISEENRWAGEGSCAWPIAEWYRRGARIIGGCCRTGPDDVRRVRAALQELTREAGRGA